MTGAAAAADDATAVGVLPGPHAAPDYFTDDAMAAFYASPYEVHYNSNRLGMRLNGPRPTWARADGGEGGSHPSNVHDHTYAIGAVRRTGDMPVILTSAAPRSAASCAPRPSPAASCGRRAGAGAAGGLALRAVCCAPRPAALPTHPPPHPTPPPAPPPTPAGGPAAPARRDPLKAITLEDAYTAALRTDALVAAVKALARGEAKPAAAAAGLEAFAASTCPAMPPTKAVLVTAPASEGHPGYLIRLAGDRYIQIEYGPMELDLTLRCGGAGRGAGGGCRLCAVGLACTPLGIRAPPARATGLRADSRPPRPPAPTPPRPPPRSARVHALERELASMGVAGLVETNAGVRSCMIEYEQRVLPLPGLLDAVTRADASIGDVSVRHGGAAGREPLNLPAPLHAPRLRTLWTLCPAPRPQPPAARPAPVHGAAQPHRAPAHGLRRPLVPRRAGQVRAQHARGGALPALQH